MHHISDRTIEDLITSAKAASKNAYCPYSRFAVGAAVLCSDGGLFVGCNVENSSYGLTVCAERNAIFQMAANGKRHILAVAIFTPTDTPTAPCGACRQVINEFGPRARIVSACNGPDRLDTTIDRLLPFAFGSTNSQ
jgi:cytidine deaminase